MKFTTTDKIKQTFTDEQKQAIIAMLERMPVLQAMPASHGIDVSVLYSENLNERDMDALQNGLRTIGRIQNAARDTYSEQRSK